jgi:hypothetical protein
MRHFSHEIIAIDPHSFVEIKALVNVGIGRWLLLMLMLARSYTVKLRSCRLDRSIIIIVRSGCDGVSDTYG